MKSFCSIKYGIMFSFFYYTLQCYSRMIKYLATRPMCTLRMYKTILLLPRGRFSRILFFMFSSFNIIRAALTLCTGRRNSQQTGPSAATAAANNDGEAVQAGRQSVRQADGQRHLNITQIFEGNYFWANILLLFLNYLRCFFVFLFLKRVRAVEGISSQNSYLICLVFPVDSLRYNKKFVFHILIN